MNSLLIIGTLFSAANAHMGWDTFKQVYNKQYMNNSIETHRRNIFDANINKINNHHHDSYKLGVNEFADLTHDEFFDNYVIWKREGWEALDIKLNRHSLFCCVSRTHFKGCDRWHL